MLKIYFHLKLIFNFQPNYFNILYDIIYVKPVDRASPDAARTNWDVLINLPPLLIEDLTIGFTDSKFTYLYISAQLKSAKIGIYALTISGNVALIVSGVPSWTRKGTISTNVTDDSLSDFTELPKNLIFNHEIGALYFSYQKSLYRYKISTRKAQLMKSFDGEITSMTQDLGWDKLVLVINNQNVFFISFNGQELHQLHLHPKMPNITSIFTWEDQLIVAEWVNYFTIFNKFTGIEFTDSKKLRMNSLGSSTLIKQLISYQSTKKPWKYYFSSDYMYRGTTVGLPKAYEKNSTTICPMNTFKISERGDTANFEQKISSKFYSEHNFVHCFCLGWDYKTPVVVSEVDFTEYQTKIPCGVPKCDKQVADRYPILRRASSNPIDYSANRLPVTKINNGTESTIANCLADMKATYSKVLDKF